MPKVSVHVIVSGRVQGVFYRANTEQKAMEFGLKGFVRNLSDGTVEAVFEGEEATIDKMIEWCRTGPKGAVVSDLKADFKEATGEFKSFEIKY